MYAQRDIIDWLIIFTTIHKFMHAKICKWNKNIFFGIIVARFNLLCFIINMIIFLLNNYKSFCLPSQQIDDDFSELLNLICGRTRAIGLQKVMTFPIWCALGTRQWRLSFLPCLWLLFCLNEICLKKKNN